MNQPGQQHRGRSLTGVLRVMGVMGVIGVIIGVAAPGLAQSGEASSLLRRVEPGIEDVGSRGIGRSNLFVDLRGGVGFRDVYTFRRESAFGSSRSMFLRKSGAVSAVFPRSAYTEGAGGLRPTIPAGTIFYMGDPARRNEFGIHRRLDEDDPSLARRDEGAGRVLAQREDRRVRMEEPAAGVNSAPSPGTSGSGPMMSSSFAQARDEKLLSAEERRVRADARRIEPPPKSLWADEPYRRGRIEQLMKEARGENEEADRRPD
jgi:hypothetical protein